MKPLTKNMISGNRTGFMVNEKGSTFVGIAFVMSFLVVVLVGGVSAGLQAFNHTTTHNKMLSVQTILSKMELDTYDTPSAIPDQLLQEVGMALGALDFYELPTNDDEAIFAIAYVKRGDDYKPVWQKKLSGGLPVNFYDPSELTSFIAEEKFIVGVGMKYRPPAYVYNVCEVCQHEYKKQIQ